MPRLILFLAALSFLSIVACERSAAPVNLTFDGQECVHEGPESIAAGEVRLTLVNKSDVPTFLAALKLHDGKTLEDVVSYLATTARDVPGWDTVLSFRAEPGSEVIENSQLAPGNYVMACLSGRGPFSVWPAGAVVVDG